jgi:hypothetical protein
MKRSTTTRGWLTAAIAGAALSGCGGSGSDTVIPLSSTVAQFQNGWTWSYNFTGTFTPTGAAKASATGTRTITCTASMGTVTLEELTTITSNTISYNHSKELSYAQGADGTLTLTGITVDTNPSETVAKTTFAQPGSITSTTNLSGIITYQDSTYSTETYQVVGIKVVDTPVADFATWQIARQTQYNNQPQVNVTESLSPTVGEPVSITGTEYVSDGTYTGTFLLASTNVNLNQNPTPILPGIKSR